MSRRVPCEADYLALRPMIKLPKSVVGRNQEEHPLVSFTLLTFNILAQDHIHRAAYPYCAKDSLRWNHRRVRLSAEIAAYDADIVCFQEMDRFSDYFQPLLTRLGYDLQYYLRNGPHSDVNCVGWKRNVFKLVSSRQVSFAGTTAGLGSVPNVSQMVALESLREPRLKLVVATTHLYWRMECDHIRLAQTHTLINAVMSFQEELNDPEFIPMIAGDFNSDHDSMAIRAVLQSPSLMAQANFQEMLEKSKMTPQVLYNILADFTTRWPRFHDAYAHYSSVLPGANSYELPYTTFCLYKGILDFILYAQYDSHHPNTFDLRITPTALRMMPDRQVLEAEVALPNHLFASDHLALMTEFTVFHNHKEGIIPIQ